MKKKKLKKGNWEITKNGYYEVNGLCILVNVKKKTKCDHAYFISGDVTGIYRYCLKCGQG